MWLHIHAFITHQKNCHPLLCQWTSSLSNAVSSFALRITWLAGSCRAQHCLRGEFWLETRSKFQVCLPPCAHCVHTTESENHTGGWGPRVMFCSQDSHRVCGERGLLPIPAVLAAALWRHTETPQVKGNTLAVEQPSTAGYILHFAVELV